MYQTSNHNSYIFGISFITFSEMTIFTYAIKCCWELAGCTEVRHLCKTPVRNLYCYVYSDTLYFNKHNFTLLKLNLKSKLEFSSVYISVHTQGWEPISQIMFIWIDSRCIFQLQVRHLKCHAYVCVWLSLSRLESSHQAIRMPFYVTFVNTPLYHMGLLAAVSVDNVTF